MKSLSIACLTGTTWLLAGGAAGMIIYCEGPEARLVTTEHQRPAELEYHHAVAAEAALAVAAAGSASVHDASHVIGRGTVEKPPPVARGGVRGGRATMQDRAAEAVKLCNRGLLQLQSGKVAEAIDAFEKAIQISPKDSRAHMLRGVAAARKGQHGEALDFYEKALDLDPSSVEAYQSRGLTFMRLDRLPLAVADFTKAVTINPKFEEGYLRRGLAYGRLGEFEKSVADNTAAIALNPDNSLSYNNRAAAYKALGRTREADADLDKSRQLEVAEAAEAKKLKK